MEENEGTFESNDSAAAGCARLDVLAYLKALVSRNDQDAQFILGQALDTTPEQSAQFLWQLSTLATAQFEILAQAAGFPNAVEFIGAIQTRELARQAAGE